MLCYTATPADANAGALANASLLPKEAVLCCHSVQDDDYANADDDDADLTSNAWRNH